MRVLHRPVGFQNRLRLSLIAPLLVVLAAASPNAQSTRPGGTASASLSPTDAWDTMTADVTIRRSRVDNAGKAIGPATPVVQYRWQRAQSGSRWKTTVLLNSMTLPVVESAKGPTTIPAPVTVVRMEDDEDGTPLRFYDSRGEEVRPLTTSDSDMQRLGLPGQNGRGFMATPLSSSGPGFRPAVTGRDWIDAVIAQPAKGNNRRVALERKFGRAQGKVKGLDRFVGPAPDGLREVLVNRESLLPVEMNIVKAGVLVTHSTFEYEPRSNGLLVRRLARTEQLQSDGSGERLISEVELANVRLERKGGSK